MFLCAEYEITGVPCQRPCCPPVFPGLGALCDTGLTPGLVTTIPIVSVRLWMCNGPATSAPHYYSLRHIICYLSGLPRLKRKISKND